MGKESQTMKIKIILAVVMFSFSSCVYQQEPLVNATCPVSDQDVDRLFNGIVMAIFRHSNDTNNLVYCFKFRNDRGCIVSMNRNHGNGFFVDIEENEVDSIKHLLTEEQVYFEERYGCNVEQIQDLVHFCSENNFNSVIRHRNDASPLASYTCHTSRTILFYSKDSTLFNKEMYKELGQHWYTPKRKTMNY